MAPSYPEHYPIRIVTFIDILGFALDVLKVDEKPGLYLSIDAVLRHIANCKRDIDNARRTRGVRFDHRITQFSDCLVMSYANEPGASLRAIADAAFIGHVILRPGYLPRGAIVVGTLVHDDAVVFGSALVHAHRLESSEVDTPRIAVTDEVLKLITADLIREQPNDSLEMYVRDRGSGPFVHVLGKDWPFLGEEKAKQEAGIYATDGIAEMYRELHDMLPIRFHDAPHERAARKNEWIRNYVNDTIDEQGLSQAFKITF